MCVSMFCYLKSYLALSSLSVPAVQIEHERLITFLPKKGHVLMTLAERLDLILLHVGYNLTKQTKIKFTNYKLLYKL